MEEVQPPGRQERHCGSGFELVLNATVPQLGREVAEEGFSVLRVAQLLGLEGDPGGGGRVRQRTVDQNVDTILDSTQNSSTSWERSRSAHRVAQEQVQQRTAEQIADRPRVSSVANVCFVRFFAATVMNLSACFQLDRPRQNRHQNSKNS